ncbi:MAG: efflux RND transporter periplasmic adaptor subunit [Pseudomonadales bacterium]|nr:efflux RND transporter periplasmic adaptor subunit [Pseudomonadales bacterium]
MIKKSLIPLLIVTVCGLAAYWMSAQQTMPAQRLAPPPTMLVDVIKAVKQTIQIQVDVQGTVAPRTQTNLISEVSGLIMEVSPAFVAGGFFKQGDLLVRIDARNYLAEVKRAEASVASARTAVTKENGLAEYAAADWQRSQTRLSSSKSASNLTLRKPQLAEAIANLQFAQAELVKRQGDLDRTVIRAPYDGLIRQKKADIGQYVTVGSQLAETFAVDVAEIRLPLPDREIPYLALPSTITNPGPGPRVELTAEIGGEIHHWHGNIVRTEGVFDEASRVLYVIAQVIDPYNQLNNSWQTPLRIGTFVNASISGRQTKNLIKLPRSVLNANNHIWTINDQQQLIAKKVSLYRTDDQFIYVNNGLNDTETVCLTTLDNPLPGTLVRQSLHSPETTTSFNRAHLDADY